MKDLVGKTAVVTGAGSGIGRAMAKRWAEAGMNVVLADVDEVALAAAITEISQVGPTAGLPVDVTAASEVEDLLAFTIDRFDRAHLVCNNAGVAGPPGLAPHELTVQDWQWVLDVDLWGVVHGIRAFVPHLLSYGDGHIVNTASQSGLTSGAVISAAYYAAKHAVVALSECQFHDFSQRAPGIGVSVLCPGPVATNIMHDEAHRPERFQTVPTPVATERSDSVASAMWDVIASGRPADEVAEIVHDAVINEEFYIFTDPNIIESIAARHRAIEQRGLPTTGRMDADVTGS
ncbi:MAG: hypothetical protein CL456_07155 [Acidimicrobiaceae bacterium]|nr:hypothetical protein [Acidimicrobiaceae bacterium]